LSQVQFIGDYVVDPSNVGARTVEGALRTVDRVLLDDTPVLEYLRRTGQSIEAYRNADVRTRARIEGEAIGAATTVVIEAVVARGATRFTPGGVEAPNTPNDDTPNIDPTNPRPGNANSPNTDAEAGGGSTLPEFVGPTGRAINPADANRGFGRPPFDPSRPIFDFETNGTTTFQRVYTEGVTGRSGGFLLNADDIRGLTPQQIKDKFDLPHLPTHVVDVTPRAGTIIRTGTVNAGNFGGTGGGRQFLLRTPISPRAFVNPRPLPGGN
jgi:hypothetical protein